MMISHYEHIVGEEGVSWGPEAAIAGASNRLAPILMTSIVTALGPFAAGHRHERAGPRDRGGRWR